MSRVTFVRAARVEILLSNSIPIQKGRSNLKDSPLIPSFIHSLREEDLVEISAQPSALRTLSTDRWDLPASYPGPHVMVGSGSGDGGFLICPLCLTRVLEWMAMMNRKLSLRPLSWVYFQFQFVKFREKNRDNLIHM